MIEVDGAYWTGNLGPQIHFGQGALQRCGEWLDVNQKWLVICGQSALRYGFLDQLKHSMKSSASLVVYDKMAQDPTDENLNDILRLIQSEQITALIGLGGGSAMDAAKAASVMAPSQLSLENAVTRTTFDQKIFCVAIPTTAGTGAELSQGAILTWREKKIKVGVRGALVKPDVAIVDPLLTKTLPKRQVQVTGFDIFTHAVETYISKKCNPIVAHNSLMAIRAVVRYLPQALSEKENLHARHQLSFYSMLMGYNLANSSTCLPHRLQYPLGVETKTEHAFGLAALYPAWVRLTQGSSPLKFDKIAQIINEEMGLQETGIEDSLREWMSQIELTPRLADLSLSRSDCVRLASLVEGSLGNDPWWESGVDLTPFYEQSL